MNSNLGFALVDDEQLMQTSKLWTDQQFTHNDLVAAETTCRVLLAHREIVLLANLATDARFAPDDWDELGPGSPAYYPPELFSFTYPSNLPTSIEIDSLPCTEQAKEIAELVRSQLKQSLRIKEGETSEDAINVWFNGWERHPGSLVASEIAELVEARKHGRLITQDELDCSGAFLDKTAECILTFHRRGFSTYGGNPVLKLAHTIMYEKLPLRFFKTFDEEFQHAQERSLLPGSPLPIPPVLQIVLSRAANRNEILPTILEMRDEFSQARTELWEIMVQMRLEPTLKKRLRAERKLREASDNLFKAVDTRRVSGIWVTFLAVLQQWKDVGEAFWRNDSPNRAVSSVSFAHRLRKEVHKIQPTEDVLRRHLSRSELRGLGME